MARAYVLAGLVPVGFQVMTLDNSTAVSLNSTLRANANVLHVSVETNDCRFRADSTAATLTTGVLLSSANSPYEFHGFNGTANWTFQRATGTSKVSVMGFEQQGSRN